MALPAPHAAHAVAALASEYVPRAHAEHACDETDPRVAPNLPAVQFADASAVITGTAPTVWSFPHAQHAPTTFVPSAPHDDSHPVPGVPFFVHQRCAAYVLQVPYVSSKPSVSVHAAAVLDCTRRPSATAVVV